MSTPRRLGLLVTACALLLTGSCGGATGTVTGANNLRPLFNGTGKLYMSQDNNGNGLFLLDTTTGAATLVGSGITGVTSSTIGLTETQDPNFLLGSRFSGILRIAVNGSGATLLPGSVAAEGLAMNITTGILYGIINNNFFTIDPVTGLNTGGLTAPGVDVEGLAADPFTNRIFGIVRFTGGQNLMVYSVAGNSWSVVGDTGRTWNNPGLAYDHFNGVLYAIDDNTDSLYRIDPTTAATTLVGPCGTRASGGLAFVADGAPTLTAKGSAAQPR